jgi:PUA domain protein|tara:strand:+ start:194 stop:703 length:510 start_codon:yes stop_codon:yes gene_type:complete
MTRDWSMKKRRPVRRKKVAPLLTTLEEALGIDLQVDGAFLEMAEYGPWSMVLVNKIAKAIEVTNEENERFVFLTLRGFLEHDNAAKWVEVDHGAIPFLMKGADCMVAGVHAADASIEVGDLVWIRDMKHKRPLAIGWSTMSADDLTNLSKGKGIKTLHWVGDELWDMEP